EPTAAPHRGSIGSRPETHRVSDPGAGARPKARCSDRVLEDTPEKLLLSLSAHELDVVLTDAPAYSAARVRVFNHLLGSSGVALFASPSLANVYRKRFSE